MFLLSRRCFHLSYHHKPCPIPTSSSAWSAREGVREGGYMHRLRLGGERYGGLSICGTRKPFISVYGGL